MDGAAIADPKRDLSRDLAAHREAVFSAVEAGESVPLRVLVDFPDLHRRAVKAATAQARQRAGAAMAHVSLLKPQDGGTVDFSASERSEAQQIAAMVAALGAGPADPRRD